MEGKEGGIQRHHRDQYGGMKFVETESKDGDIEKGNRGFLGVCGKWIL